MRHRVKILRAYEIGSIPAEFTGYDRLFQLFSAEGAVLPPSLKLYVLVSLKKTPAPGQAMEGGEDAVLTFSAFFLSLTISSLLGILPPSQPISLLPSASVSLSLLCVT